jgi:hypothetical protein
VRGHHADLELFVDGKAMVPRNAPPQCIELWANDRRIARWHFRIGKRRALAAQIKVPAELIRDCDVLMLTFLIGSPHSPVKIGASADPRPLGLHLRSVSLVQSA